MKETYIISEIGQNHNGDKELAKTLMDLAAIPIYDKWNGNKLKGVNAVKLTKRDLNEELSNKEYNRKYDNPHSYGDTYGKHREALELSYDEHIELFHYAKKKDLDFIETFCSPKTLQLLNDIDVDRIKVASRDLTNIPLLEEIGKAKKPVILSTGMSNEKEISKALNIIEKYHSDISILHCVSAYPPQYEELNLLSIKALKEKYGDKYKIGYSDHSIGIVVPPVAVAMGAGIIEKHITLNRELKGSDHKGSLEMDGLWRMTRDIRNIEKAMGEKKIFISEAVKPNIEKLRRSLAVKRDIEKGEIIKEKNLYMVSPGLGLRWEERNKIIGKKAIKKLPKNTLIKKDMVK